MRQLSSSSARLPGVRHSACRLVPAVAQPCSLCVTSFKQQLRPLTVACAIPQVRCIIAQFNYTRYNNSGRSIATQCQELWLDLQSSGHHSHHLLPLRITHAEFNQPTLKTEQQQQADQQQQTAVLQPAEEPATQQAADAAQSDSSSSSSQSRKVGASGPRASGKQGLIDTSPPRGWSYWTRAAASVTRSHTHIAGDMT